MKMSLKRSFKVLLKLAVTGGIFAYLLSKTPLAPVAALLTGVNVPLLAVAVGCYVLAQTLSALRWQRVAQSLRLRASYGYFWAQYFAAMWLSQALPSGIGGDVYRAWHLGRRAGRHGAAASSVLLERLSGFGVMLGLGVVLLPLYVQNGALWPLSSFLLLLGAGGAVGLPVLVLLARHRHGRRLWQLRFSRWLWRLSRDVNRVFFARWQLLGWHVVMSVLIQGLNLLMYAVLAHALGLSIPFWLFVALVPPVILTMLVPISFAGWGLREGAMVWVMTTAGLLTAPQALSLSLLVGVTTLLAAGVGLGVFVMRSVRR